MLLKIYLFLLAYTQLSSASSINSSALGVDANSAGSYGIGRVFSNITCDTVPYPFGTAGIAFPGFEILGCSKEEPQTNTPQLSLPNNTYSIFDISLQGYIKIFAGPIHKRCYGANGVLTESKGSGLFNLDGTPFTMSYQHNMLTVVGCNNLVLVTSQQNNLTSGCVTFCDPQGMLSDRSCSGLGCCQATLPGPLKSFDLEFKQVILNSSVNTFNCSALYFGRRDDFQPDHRGFRFENLDIDDENNLIHLDWVIGTESCEVARNNITSFACKNNSYCNNSVSAVGYLCNCIKGYEGSPYANDGCTGTIYNSLAPPIPLFEIKTIFNFT